MNIEKTRNIAVILAFIVMVTALSMTAITVYGHGEHSIECSPIMEAVEVERYTEIRKDPGSFYVVALIWANHYLEHDCEGVEKRIDNALFEIWEYQDTYGQSAWLDDLSNGLRFVKSLF